MPGARYDQLTASQKEAVFHFEGPLLVLAGPGSGKTRVITYRIAALIDAGVPPSNICAITFTNKAADEMRQRVLGLGTPRGTHISTFHSLCVKILRQYAHRAGINSNFSIYDEADQAKCIKQAVKDCELDTANFPPARMLEIISTRLKNNLIDVESFKAQADDFFSQMLARIYARYQQILAQHNALDFDDLLTNTAWMLESCPDVVNELGNRFRFLLIDEYQDTNYAQYKIAKALVSKHNNICVTGDPDQSIYRWRGADIRNILTFENDWPDATVVRLEENFRSTGNILKIADNLISHNQNRKEKRLIPTNSRPGNVVVASFEDEVEEAAQVAQQIKELAKQGVALRDIAVFYRVNAASRVLEEAFISNKIPYQIVRGVEFYNRKEIRDLLSYLKVLVNPNDEVALLRIINTPARGIGRITIDKVRAYATLNNISFFEALQRAQHISSLSEATRAKLARFVTMIKHFKMDLTGQVSPLIERVFIESGLQQSLQGSDVKEQSALENVEELINAAGRYDQQTEHPSLLDYLQQVSLVSDVDDYDTSTDRVALMTLHTAKGLEFEHVFIVGVEQGLLPYEKSDVHYEHEQELEEERRLFFVGITRAKTGLYISYTKYRTVRGQMRRTIPSQFIFELGADLAVPAHYCYDQHGYKYRKGQLVRHKSFGLGKIKEFIDMGEDSIIVVEFNSGQTKSLMVKYANLSKI